MPCWYEKICEKGITSTTIEHSPNAMILNGFAGTGKSYTIRMMIAQTLSLPGNENKKVLVMAPTGKAALQAGGVTLHSKYGIYLPILKGKEIKRLSSAKLRDLQNRLKDVCAIIIDEYSMLSLIDLCYINDRLQAAYCNQHSFGGIPIAFVGDPGQLPPVGGLSLWTRKDSRHNPLTGLPLKGSLLYTSIKTVMKLSIVQRQTDPQVLDFLLAVRDGKVTE